MYLCPRCWGLLVLMCINVVGFSVYNSRSVYLVVALTCAL